MSDQFEARSVNRLLTWEYVNLGTEDRAEVYVANRKPTLEEAQKVVGGLVELVTIQDMFGNEVQILVNEEGAFGLPQNKLASIMTGNTLFGPALLLAGEHRWD